MCRWQLSLLQIYGQFLILWLGFHCASQPIHGWLINKEMRKETWLLVKQSKEAYSHLRTKKRFKSCLNLRGESMCEPEIREHVKELLESHQLAGVGREHLTDPLCKRVHLSLKIRHCWLENRNHPLLALYKSVNNKPSTLAFRWPRSHAEPAPEQLLMLF